jgi:hypothetical protein
MSSILKDGIALKPGSHEIWYCITAVPYMGADYQILKIRCLMIGKQFLNLYFTSDYGSDLSMPFSLYRL